jgi:hypothetical protein
MSDHINTISFDFLLDEELTRYTQLFKALLEEMKAWDIEDAEDAATGKFSLPPQLYRELPRFEILTQNIRHIEIIQKQRLEQDGNVPETPVCSLAPPQSTPLCRHNNTTTTSPTDIIAPKPFPPSPNILVRLPQSHPHTSHNHYLPDIVAPPPLPPKPNIPVYHLRCSGTNIT